jgi:hypothetical protein
LAHGSSSGEKLIRYFPSIIRCPEGPLNNKMKRRFSGSQELNTNEGDFVGNSCKSSKMHKQWYIDANIIIN